MCACVCVFGEGGMNCLSFRGQNSLCVCVWGGGGGGGGGNELFIL